MKKTIILVLCVILLFVLIISCSKSSKQEKEDATAMIKAKKGNVTKFVVSIDGLNLALKLPEIKTSKGIIKREASLYGFIPIVLDRKRGKTGYFVIIDAYAPGDNRYWPSGLDHCTSSWLFGYFGVYLSKHKGSKKIINIDDQEKIAGSIGWGQPLDGVQINIPDIFAIDLDKDGSDEVVIKSTTSGGGGGPYLGIEVYKFDSYGYPKHWMSVPVYGLASREYLNHKRIWLANNVFMIDGINILNYLNKYGIHGHGIGKPPLTYLK